MKRIIQKYLQALLGFENYLFVFSIYIISTLRFNRKEKDFLHFLNMLPDNCTVLDIGANIGIMTVHFARKLKNSMILSMEPIPDNIKALERIVRFYKLENVKVINTALGNENGKVEMLLPVIRSVKMQGLSHVLHPDIQGYKDGKQFTVGIRKLDDLIQEMDIDKPLKAIKIDVENFEYFVLQGGKELIENTQPYIYMELWDNENRNKCFELLSDFGYTPQVGYNRHLVDFEGSNIKTQNFFFIPGKTN